MLNDLLSLAGSITDHLLHSKEERATKLALLAQTSPTLLEWMRKQVYLVSASTYTTIGTYTSKYNIITTV